MIIIDKLTKKFGDRKILDQLSLKIEDGELVSIIGKSGVGKSTLLHILIAAETIDFGKVIVNGQEVDGIKPAEIQNYRRKIGIVFQDFKLLPKKTVYENVAFALEVNDLKPEIVEEKTLEVLRLVDLEELRNHFPAEISGGEKQRTAIARALVHAPDLLFADEPTGNLDPENSLSLAKIFKKINKNGTTVVIATHDQVLVDHLESRVIALDQGKILRDKKKAKYNN